MSGKVLKIASNDLYGNVDERNVSVYACFEHSKYMNNYVVFSIDGSNKLCYGSIHMKAKSLVIFSVKEHVDKYILEFLDEYMSDKLDSFKILDISNIMKVELVSYSEMEYNKLNLLSDKAIPKIINDDNDTKEKKTVFMYLLIFLLVLVAIGMTVLYLKPELFTVKYKGLDCINNLYDENIELNYHLFKDIRFDLDDKITSIEVTRTYTFTDSNSYYNFKNNEEQMKYFTNGEGFKYIDEELKLKLFYSEESVIDDYDEILTYLKREGFSCIERQYEK